jgi:hypothetical protein
MNDYNVHVLPTGMYCISHIYISKQALQQMDPTDIVKVPYDLERLSVYVTSVVIALFMLAPTKNSRKIPGLVVLTVLGYGIIVLCGASPTHNPRHTLMASLYTMALIWLDPPIFVDDATATTTAHTAFNQPSTWSASAVVSTFQQFQLLVRGRRRPRQPSATTVSSSQPQQPQQHPQAKVAMAVAHSVVAFNIPCQILLLFDAGLQVQRWPVPTIMASTFGWAVGLVVGTMWAVIESSTTGVNVIEKD